MHQINGGGSGDGTTSLATVASVAIIASLGLTYILDKYKDKSDKNLWEELKDRIKDQIQDSQTKLKNLESMQAQLSNQMLSSQQIDTLVNEKIRRYENNQSLENNKNKALNLKIKA